ncbi:hypothetical protein [Kineococcus xinjiangensis]|uniref:hypothetical protein n=1 Tax=Kineococcus xinjiangensis TaxID=512762 RepID=UPI000CEBD38C|nr:hypothetical protein [Kineococcus xinjiangensis]
MPARPPALLSGPTAHQLGVRLLIHGALAFAVSLTIIFLIPEAQRHETLGFIPVMALGFVPFILTGRWWKAVGRRKIEELQHGYTTLTITFGQFHNGGGSHVRDTDAGPPWDYSGTWVLHRDGRVKSAPQPGYDPPGLYPSPVRRGAYELWTGASWTGHYTA